MQAAAVDTAATAGSGVAAAARTVGVVESAIFFGDSSAGNQVFRRVLLDNYGAYQVRLLRVVLVTTYLLVECVLIM